MAGRLSWVPCGEDTLGGRDGTTAQDGGGPHAGEHGNGLSGPIPSELAQLTHLRTLDLGGNQLSGRFPPELGRLTNLLALLLGCGLRRQEAVAVEFQQIGRRDGRWVIIDSDPGTMEINLRTRRCQLPVATRATLSCMFRVLSPRRLIKHSVLAFPRQVLCFGLPQPPALPYAPQSPCIFSRFGSESKKGVWKIQTPFRNDTVVLTGGFRRSLSASCRRAP